MMAKNLKTKHKLCLQMKQKYALMNYRVQNKDDTSMQS